MATREAEAEGEPEIVAKGVASFDLCADGSVVYSDGQAVFWIDAKGKREQIAAELGIAQVAVLE